MDFGLELLVFDDVVLCESELNFNILFRVLLLADSFSVAEEQGALG